MLAGVGVGFRAMAAALGRSGAQALVCTEDLARLPKSIGQWRGTDQAIDKTVAAYTDADALLNRVYARGPQAVLLYIAGGVRARDMMPHRPTVCYPTHGWTQQDDRQLQLKLADGTTLSCHVYMFGKAGLSTKSVKVLNYYIVDGSYGADVSTLRSKVRRGSTGVRYLAQVQLSCNFEPGAQNPQEMLEDFIGQAAPLILSLMPDAGAATLPAGREGT
jgi:EpsI family protein